ncbi:MAG: bifunctional phosphopantothenoylcysteine decarboxylase/phosphopantothenate--cysteine ligase CoaBC [Armatimonadota bacterium]
MLKGKKILLGVTGGIAAYKSAYLVSSLIKQGNEVKVVMTDSAQKFVAPLTFSTLSRGKVYTDMFRKENEYDIEHINLGKWADFILIAPATYNTIGKISSGIADDLLSSIVAAYTGKIFLCPAMNDGMYNNPVLKENIEKLEKLGYVFMGPETGRLACGDDAEGRMTEPEDIISFLDKLYSGRMTELKLKGKKILITAGPTREAIDPVRFISNYSSGKMGYALAEASEEAGAQVTLISGPTSLKTPKNTRLINVESADQMLKSVNKYFPGTDIFISCAAVCDYKPEKKQSQKIKKNRDCITLDLTKNTDILKEASKKKNGALIAGFAAESENIIKNAKQKLKEKNLDIIIANDISRKNSGFESDFNKITVITKNGKVKKFNKMLKKDCAKIIMEEIYAFSN